MPTAWWRVTFDHASIEERWERWDRDLVSGVTSEVVRRRYGKSVTVLWESFPKRLYATIDELPTARREIPVWAKEELGLWR